MLGLLALELNALYFYTTKQKLCKTQVIVAIIKTKTINFWQMSSLTDSKEFYNMIYNTCVNLPGLTLTMSKYSILCLSEGAS